MSKAGRPPKGPISSERHEKRRRVLPSQPVHVVMRCIPDVPVVVMHEALRLATLAVAPREAEFRIVHAGVAGEQVHLVVEASDRTQLARGMLSFQISAAKHVNRQLRRRGAVFLDRYHPTILATPRMVRAALALIPASPALPTWAPKTVLLQR